MIATGPGWELRLGDWRDVLADVSVDAVITDPPYSERTQRGHDSAVEHLLQENKYDFRRVLSYKSFSEEDISDFVDGWISRCSGWFAVMSDSVLFPTWRLKLEAAGLTGFQPIPCVIPGMTVRVCGDGPSSWAVYLNVARPKALSKWGTLPGAYISKRGERVWVGGKPLDLMRAIIRDYTKPDDFVCDPCAGAATTLLAAVMEGRKAIGAEIDPEAFEKGVARLKRGYTPSLFQEVSP